MQQNKYVIFRDVQVKFKPVYGKIIVLRAVFKRHHRFLGHDTSAAAVRADLRIAVCGYVGVACVKRFHTCRVRTVTGSYNLCGGHNGNDAHHGYKRLNGARQFFCFVHQSKSFLCCV